ncbi:Interferon-induced protein with tetratricopeptide repeats 1 [Collichthys lucidus]|uniref:Interferon-induced protein with tetratricopeptide repeats 1 n=1 Tax=Collichthys lucidus TaxID=240159 RepID=A0A4U5UK36_COLLU|nr:Interferon-induced protein with tetratricopeptide repeats 1 [Collichthys lucidus]
MLHATCYMLHVPCFCREANDVTALLLLLQLPLEDRLNALECHFTWDLDPSQSKLYRLRDNLEDIGTEEGYSWLGHIYNLQGYVHYRLGSGDDAQRFFGMAAEAFRQMRNTVSDEGPWLVINYGNLAWLHYERGEQAESRDYLSQVDRLINEYPSASEIYAEKAWTLMHFGAGRRQQAAEYFQRAIRMQPDMVEWHTSYALTLFYQQRDQELEDDVLEKMRIARMHDPENLYLAALYLVARARKGQNVQVEARELAPGVLRKPVSSYSGIKPFLRLYRMHVSMDEAIDLAEDALGRHPDERYLKLCAALSYKMKIFLQVDSPLEESMVNRAISLCTEVISLYPQSSLKMKVALADIHAKSGHIVEADQLYEEMLEGNPEPEDAQMLYNCYAKYLHFVRQEIHRSIDYHMRAAEIPVPSKYRNNSIRTLRRVLERQRNRMCREIQEFLDNLQL